MNDEPVTLSLRTPIDAHGQKVSSITLRVPNGGDLSACGTPASDSMDTPGFGAYVCGMTSRLAGIPPSSVNQLHRLDWLGAAAAVLGFFGKEEVPDKP